MTTPEEKIISAKAYIIAVINWWSVSPNEFNDYEDVRNDAHKIMIETYDCNRGDVQAITSNLDIWIGLELDRGVTKDFKPVAVNLYALKLHNILESKAFKEGGFNYVHEETKRLRELWYNAEGRI